MEGEEQSKDRKLEHPITVSCFRTARAALVSKK